MSRRTSESSKAIRLAWNNEQQLIQKGKATREWTPTQQQDILEKGKAYDEDGRAFEGQHMMSAEKYPEYQGNPENIQFLTRGEHLEAHDGNWQNPTNWYFNPITKEKTDFSNGNFKPCEIINLYDPVVRLQVNRTIEKEVSQEVMTETLKKATQEKTLKTIPNTKNNVSTKPNLKFGQRMQKAFKSAVEKAVEFKVKHPTATKAIEGTLKVAVTAVVAGILETINNRSSNSEHDLLNDEYETSNKTDYSTIVEDNTQSIERSSPDEHNVRSHGQHYNTKDGRIWKEKDSYHRGGKKG